MHSHALLVSSLSFLSISSSLSLFVLSLSIFDMAPKKFAPSKNPISCRGSSSSSFLLSLPIRDQFCELKSQKDFDENFSGWAIHSKCQVILATPLLGVFSSRGWESLCEKPLRCPSMFVQEFYSNIHAINTSIPLFTMVFRGTCIVVTSELISEVPHIPRLAHPDYPSHPRLRSISRDELASLFCEKAMVWGELLSFITQDFA